MWVAKVRSLCQVLGLDSLVVAFSAPVGRALSTHPGLWGFLGRSHTEDNS